jgi:hypothetical protein
MEMKRMSGDDYRLTAAIQDRLKGARAGFSRDEYAQLQRAVDQLTGYQLSTLRDIAPSAASDDSWSPITDFVGDDAAPDDMTAVSIAANHLQDLGLIEIQTPSAGDGLRIDLALLKTSIDL